MYYYLIAMYWQDEHVLDAETELRGPFASLEELDEDGNNRDYLAESKAEYNITILRVKNGQLERIHSELYTIQFEFAETIELED